jgi:transcriptional regulator with XRE-family HTH domain
MRIKNDGGPGGAKRDRIRRALGAKLKAARAASGLSTVQVATQIADRLPISSDVIRNYEAGASAPTLDVLAILADFYGKPLTWFAEAHRQVPFPGITGKITVHVPLSIHAGLVDEAAREGVSLGQLVVSVLSISLAASLAKLAPEVAKGRQARKK